MAPKVTLHVSQDKRQIQFLYLETRHGPHVSVELCLYKTYQYHMELRMNIVFIPYKV